MNWFTRSCRLALAVIIGAFGFSVYKDCMWLAVINWIYSGYILHSALEDL